MMTVGKEIYILTGRREDGLVAILLRMWKVIAWQEMKAKVELWCSDELTEVVHDEIFVKRHC